VKLDYAVTGDLLVYRGSTAVTAKPGSSKIYYVDLKSGKEWRLHNDWDSPGHGCGPAATDGTILAYPCVRDGRPLSGPEPGKWQLSLTTWDPATQVEKDHLCLLRYASKDQCDPVEMAVHSAGIATKLTLTTCDQGDVRYYRFSDRTLTNLSKEYGNVGYLTLSGHRVAWARRYQVEVYDLDTGKTQKIDPGKGWQCHVRMRGDRLIWTDLRNGTGSCWDTVGGDIYMHDLKTGKSEPVTTHSAMQRYPDIDGEWAIWEDSRNNPNPNPGASKPEVIDVYAKHLTTGKVLQLTGGKTLCMQPRVSNGRAFHLMLDKEKNVSVFMVDLKTRFGL
jgi:hypothetical protein